MTRPPIIPTNIRDAEPLCHICGTDLTEQEIVVEKIEGDCLCEFCRRMVREREEG